MRVVLFQMLRSWIAVVLLFAAVAAADMVGARSETLSLHTGGSIDGIAPQAPDLPPSSTPITAAPVPAPGQPAPTLPDPDPAPVPSTVPTSAAPGSPAAAPPAPVDLPPIEVDLPATVRGVLLDEAGSLLAGVCVRAAGADGGHTAPAVTDASGGFTLWRVQPGDNVVVLDPSCSESTFEAPSPQPITVTPGVLTEVLVTVAVTIA